MSSNSPSPANLQRATLRLKFPPSYVIVGAYRLCTDESLYKPAWDKCKHGVQRGLIVGFVWVCLGIDLPFTWTELFKDVSDIQNPKAHHPDPPQQHLFSIFCQVLHSHLSNCFRSFRGDFSRDQIALQRVHLYVARGLSCLLLQCRSRQTWQFCSLERK